MLGVLLSIALQGQDFPSPPFVREWTHFFDGSLGYGETPQVQGDVAFMTAGGTLIAFDLKRKIELWRWNPGDEEYVRAYFVSNGSVYATTSEGWPDERGRLAELDAKTGKVRWTVPKRGEAGPLTVADGVVYTMMTEHELWAFDIDTKKPLWKSDLRREEKSGSRNSEIEKDPVLAAGRVFVTTGENKTIALDAKTGKELWQDGPSYSFGHTPLVLGGVVVYSSDEGLKARDTASGRVIWAFDDSSSDFVGAFGGNFVFLGNGRVVALEPKTGRIAWQDRNGKEGWSGGSRYGYIAGKTLVVNTSDGTVGYSTGGSRLWTLPEGARLSQPLWYSDDRFICAGGQSLLGYTTGEYPPLPTSKTERTALATKMVADFDLLDEAEITRLKGLKDVAVLPLADKMVEQGLLEENDPEENEPGSYRNYSTVMDIARLLYEIFEGKETMELLERAEKLKDGNMAKEAILSLVAEKGDINAATPGFVTRLSKMKIDEIQLNGETAAMLQTVSDSTLPEAVDFMISLLKNEQVDRYVRELAYVSLAEVGGEKGLNAVLEERYGRRLLEPLAKRMKLSKMVASPESKRGILDTRKDANGTLWALVTSDVMGSYSDLWITHQENGQWTDPLFTGLSQSSGRNRNQPTTEQSYKGYTVSDLVTGLWFDAFVGDKTIASDKDDDGLTDLMEQRLGTDPTDADTDDDGTTDLFDPWPTVKPRPLTDEEAFYAAAFEARYHFDTDVSPAIYTAEKGMEPFEMPGWHGPVIWSSEDDSSSRTDKLSGLWEEGVGFLTFHEARDFDDDSPPSGNTITWNKDRTEGTVIISTYYGGLNGTGYLVRAKKFGDKWVVVEMEMQYIS